MALAKYLEDIIETYTENNRYKAQQERTVNHAGNTLPLPVIKIKNDKENKPWDSWMI